MNAMPPVDSTARDAVQPTLVQWLALAPLVVGTATLPAALALAVLVPVVVVTGRLLAGLAARAMPAPARLPVALIATAALIGVVALGLHAAWPSLGDAPYWLLPIALTCALPLTNESAEASAGPVLRDGFKLGLRFAAVVAVTAIARFAFEPALPLLGRPAGALLLTGLVIAVAQWLVERRALATGSAP